MRRQSGFSFLLLAIVILLVAGLYLITNRSGIGAVAQTAQEKTTRASFALIDKAIVAYAINNKRLPCPGAPTDPAGLEVPNDPTNTCTLLDGVVPWGTLGIRLDDALDAWGRKISYRVFSGAAGFTKPGGLDATACNSSQVAPLPAVSVVDGACQVKSSTSAASSMRHETKYSEFLANKGLKVNELDTIKTDIAYILISHGATGDGAYPNSTTANRLTPLPTAVSELANASAPTDNTYWIKVFSDPSLPASDPAHFDDILRYKYLADLMQETALKGFNWGFAFAELSFSAVTTPPPDALLTITLKNSGATVPALQSPLIVTLSGGLTVAASPAATTTCNPGVSLVGVNPGTATISILAGMEIPAASVNTPGSCAVTVGVNAIATGTATILAGSDTTSNGLLTKTIGWNGAGVSATYTVTPPPPPTIDNILNRSTVGAATGTTITTSNTGLNSIVFSAFTVTAFADPPNVRNVSAASGGGIGAITTGGSGTSLSTSNNEGLHFVFGADYRYLGITLLNFNTSGGGANERVMMTFYDSGNTVVSQITKQSCRNSPTTTNFTFDPGAFYRSVDIQARSVSTSTTTSSIFLLGGITACATGTEASCVVSGSLPANDCP